MRRYLGPSVAVFLLLALGAGLFRTRPAEAPWRPWNPDLNAMGEAYAGGLGGNGLAGASCVTTGSAQTISGAKTFTANIVAPEVRTTTGVGVNDNPATTQGFFASAGNVAFRVLTASTFYVQNQGGGTIISAQDGNGLGIGASGTAIQDSYAAASASIDFGSITTTTQDSAGITVTGAAVGDTCEVGPPTAAMVAGSSFTCYVSAADTVIVRHHAGGASNPGAGVFNVRVFDP